MTSKKKFIIVFCILVVFVVILFVVSFISQRNQQDAGLNNSDVDQNSYIDPVTGEVVLTPGGRTDEGITSTDSVLLGFSKLLDMGLSSDQQDLAVSYISSYGENQTLDGEKITMISLDSSTIKQNINQDSGEIMITSNIVVNKTVTQRLEISYISINRYDIFLQIFDSSNKLVFTSVFDE